MTAGLLVLALITQTPAPTPGQSPGQVQAPSPAELSRRLDELYRAQSSHGRMTMHIQTPDYERTLEMEVWSKGRDHTLVRIHSPRKERGVATLKKGKEMWNWLPKIKRTIRVPPSMMMSSWMGSDVTNDDVVRESSWEKDYTATVAKAAAGEVALQYTRRAEAAVAWDRVVACFDATTFLPKRIEFYDDKGRKARTMEYSDVRDFGGHALPARMTITPHTKQGHSTAIVYDEMKFDVPVDDDLFTLSRLRRGR